MNKVTALIICFLFAVQANSQDKKDESYATYKNKAELFYNLVYGLYYLPQYNLFSEYYPNTNQPNLNYFNDGEKSAKEVSFLWPFSGITSAVNILYKIDKKKYSASLKNLIEAQKQYRDTVRKPIGYQAYPTRLEKSDRYYDDNGLVGIDYIEAYANTKEAHYLNDAKEVFEFIISGWNNDLEGGVTWLEGVHDQKPACSNGKATVLALKIYEETKDKYYLDWGLKFYNWMYSHLRAEENIYWNDMKTADRSILKTAWTYNTGTMLQAAVSLYKITGDKAYLKEAQSLAEGSYLYFGKKQSDGRVSILDNPWFTTVLFRGYQDLYAVDQNPKYVNTIINNIDYAWANARDGKGLFYSDWNAGKDESKTSKWLLNQAAIIEIYGRIALIKK
ncbi:glycosyl hydrolase family 76 [Flavobacterium sp. GA093]|uniref:Glycosyl hydrolase family 76 n=1 Tax=Flavobacterium hydrocarbonoxydans TaxID=2683249 RepID=A0A6I4NEQ1_9FLAO|nr:glycoside hydrolase family 76 protein [Flavobacterium hydrocarbonoxydans]MWB93096.1 glycosyl hydrolase family 76 [Flavobacterium hydrocarbonoxydans]